MSGEKKTNNLQEKWLKKFGAENTYNKYCSHLTSDYRCKIKMDMIFCGNKCAYATNVKGALRTNKKGRVVGINDNKQ